MRILVIAPPLILQNYRSRWKDLANEMEAPHHVRALVPDTWYRRGYGEAEALAVEPETEGRFELRPVPVTSSHNSFYKIKRLSQEVASFSPDLIFCVHHEGIWQLRQSILSRFLRFRNVTLIYFSMTAFPRVPARNGWRPKEWLKQAYFRVNWFMIKNGTDGALCHYDRIERQMRSEGYRKPILQQTQYGVDAREFRPDPQGRQRIRGMYGLTGCVIGFCGRFVPEKGLRELMQSVDRLQGDWQLLLIGDGDMREEIEQWKVANSLEKRVILPGFVPHPKVHAYFQAMDIFFLGSKETATYIDTFPLVVAQAMSTGLPVVGSRSGAIPYQLGDSGRLFQEGDVELLRSHLQKLLDDPEERLVMGERLRKRAHEHFCIRNMNRRLMEFVSPLVWARSGKHA